MPGSGAEPWLSHISTGGPHERGDSRSLRGFPCGAGRPARSCGAFIALGASSRNPPGCGSRACGRLPGGPGIRLHFLLEARNAQNAISEVESASVTRTDPRRRSVERPGRGPREWSLRRASFAPSWRRRGPNTGGEERAKAGLRNVVAGSFLPSIVLRPCLLFPASLRLCARIFFPGYGACLVTRIFSSGRKLPISGYGRS